MKNARRIVVEDWVYDPKNYNPKQRLIEIDKKLYLNSYIPGDLWFHKTEMFCYGIVIRSLF